jgi:hypothetical protein
MAVEATKSGDRQIVGFTWDKEIVTGEIVQLYCVNPENGDISMSGYSKNDGEGYVTYPIGYSGSTEITVYDNDGNADFGLVTVGEGGEVAPPEPGDPPVPTHPIVLPPDSDLKPEHPIVLPPEGGEGGEEPPVPTHPIELPPEIWPNPPEGSAPIPEHPIVIVPPGIWGGGNEPFPTPPIVIVLPPDDSDDDFWTGNLPPFTQPVE